MTDAPEEIWLLLLPNAPSLLAKGTFVWMRQKIYDDDIKYVREDKVLELNAKITELQAEVARCHARLEIDHHSGRPFLREEIPYDQRGKIPDDLECRDETIRLLDGRIEKQSRCLDKHIKEILLPYLNMIAVPAPVWEDNKCFWVNMCIGNYELVTDNGNLCHKGISTFQLKSFAWFDNEKDARDYVEKRAILALDARQIGK